MNHYGPAEFFVFRTIFIVAVFLIVTFWYLIFIYKKAPTTGKKVIKAMVIAIDLMCLVAFCWSVSLLNSETPKVNHSTESGKRYCGSCDKYFEEGTKDASSIAKTGLCSSCYSDFSVMKQFVDK